MKMFNIENVIRVWLVMLVHSLKYYEQNNKYEKAFLCFVSCQGFMLSYSSLSEEMRYNWEQRAVIDRHWL